ncbi:MAG: Lrp/AsnC family transcriptional regulator [Candidatus Woesearchaeota archaeon]|nr:Lrp/AsnC family transcriptional regulator [Candidatus Woesearchaeota archaeon]
MREIDETIVEFMRKNARTNLTTISKETGIPVSTIFDRLRLQEGKSITRFTALLDFPTIGYLIRAKIFLHVAPSQRTLLAAHLQEHENVNSLWRVNNGYDYALDCAFHDIKEAEDFVEELEMEFKILAKSIFHVIDTLVQEKMMVKPEEI